jgi:hypothetical protein
MMMMMMMMMIQNLDMRWVSTMTPHGTTQITKARMGGRR